MRASRAADLWWRVASIYSVDVEKYADSDGDGIGDFRGLTERVEHLDRLGVTCIWLMPFFPTANLDDGYDNPGETIRRAIGLGIVGANVEDRMRDFDNSKRLFEVFFVRQCRRIDHNRPKTGFDTGHDVLELFTVVEV